MSTLRYLCFGQDPGYGPMLAATLDSVEVEGQHELALEAAKAVLSHARIDLVLVHLSPPGDGLRLIEWVIQRLPEVSVVAITPAHPLSRLADAVRVGVHGFLIEPVTARGLADEIAKVLSRRRRASQVARVPLLSPAVDLTEILTDDAGYEAMLRCVVDHARRELRADLASVVCLDEESGDIAVASVDLRNGDAQLAPGAGRSEYWRFTAGQLAAASAGAGVDDGDNHVLTSPLAASGSVVGVLAVSRRGDRPGFSAGDTEVLSGHAVQCGAAVTSAFALRRIRQAYWNTIRALAWASEMRDRPVAGHADRLVGYALSIGRRLGLERRDLQHLRAGALLHDVGKIGINDAILGKPGKVTAAEYELIKTHTTVGAELLAAASFPQAVVDSVLHHHERYDGRGYPERLGGVQIPLEARILAVVDAFDVMTTGRPYKPPVSVGAAVMEMATCAGTQFDPGIVEVFKTAIRDGDVSAPRVAVGLERVTSGHSAGGMYGD